jgi:hypothetical protein
MKTNKKQKNFAITVDGWTSLFREAVVLNPEHPSSLFERMQVQVTQKRFYRHSNDDITIFPNLKPSAESEQRQQSRNESRYG